MMSQQTLSAKPTVIVVGCEVMSNFSIIARGTT